MRLRYYVFTPTTHESRNDMTNATTHTCTANGKNWNRVGCAACATIAATKATVKVARPAHVCSTLCGC